MFEIFKILKSREKTNLIVLDDFVSSLDDINRTELLRYLFEQVLEGSPVIRYQLIILTHHTHFYNRIKFAINDTYPEHKSKWSFFKLYEHDNYINAFSESDLNLNGKLQEISTELEKPDAIQRLPSIGNDIRKQSEIMGYLVAETLQLSPKISIEDILQLSNISKNPFYFKREVVNNKTVTKVAVHLLEDIKELLEDSNQNELKAQLEAKIAEYQSTENLEIIDTILQQFRLIKLYRKAALHSLSHGQVEEVNYSVSNLKASIKILKEVNILRKKVNKSS